MACSLIELSHLVSWGLAAGLMSGCTPDAVSQSGAVHPDDPATAMAPLDPTDPNPRVLAQREVHLAGAPPWTQVVSAVEVIDGTSLLVATGKTQGIQNPALARNAAEARARAELARRLNTQVLRGSKVLEVWRSPEGVTFARVGIPWP